MTGIPKKVRDLVSVRAQGRCEGCGGYADLELHHRKFRSRGGQHTASNLVALCGWGNHTGCHGKAHSAEPPRGWALRSWQTPDLEPFLSFEGLVWLTVDGRRVLVGEEPNF